MMERNSECWYRDVCEVESCSACIRYLEMKYLLDNSGIPQRRQYPQKLSAQQCDLAAYTRLASIKSEIVDFVEQGRNLYIASDCTGNGKTSWAIKLMLKYFDSIWAGNGLNVRGLFVHVPSLLIQLKNFSNRDDTLERMKKTLPTVDLVVWDDIASTDISAYDYSQLLMYMDARALEQKANIYTGNYADRDRLEKRVGAKLTSRIWGHDTEVIIFTGGDMR